MQDSDRLPRGGAQVRRAAFCRGHGSVAEAWCASRGMDRLVAHEVSPAFVPARGARLSEAQSGGRRTRTALGLDRGLGGVCCKGAVVEGA